MGVRYANRRQLKRAGEIAYSAYIDGLLDRALEAASRSVDDLCDRRFYPTTDTRYFPWPGQYGKRDASVPVWAVWLDDDELLELTSLTSGGDSISTGSVFLEPANEGPPYQRLEVDLSTTAAFSQDGTHQRAIAVTGVFGAWDEEESVGDLSDTFTTAHTTLTITPAGDVDVGDTLHIDDEYVHITGVAFADTGQNLQSALSGTNPGDDGVDVSDGSTFAVNEIVQVGTERMLVVAVAGNTLTVQRAYDGSTLAAHSSDADVYAQREFTVQRGRLGSTTAEHSSGATVYRLTYPASVVELTIAEALLIVEGHTGRWERSVRGGIRDLRDRVEREHARRLARALAV